MWLVLFPKLNFWPAAASLKKSSLNTAELSMLNTCGPAGAGVTSDSGGGGGGTAAELDSEAGELGGILYIHGGKFAFSFSLATLITYYLDLYF